MSRRRAAENLAIGMSEPHCVLVRRLPCLMCGVAPAGTVHHLKQGEAREYRGGTKAPDRFVVPLCWLPCHSGLEDCGSRAELEIFARHGIADPNKVAADLWAITLEARAYDRLRLMLSVIIAAREGFAI